MEVVKKNRALTEDFTKLHLELEKEGIFEVSYTHSFLRTMEFILLFAFAIALLQWQNCVARFIGSIMFGLAGGRAAYLGHELGHLSYSGNPKFDRIVHAVTYGKINILNALTFCPFVYGLNKMFYLLQLLQYSLPILLFYPLLKVTDNFYESSLRLGCHLCS